MRASVRRAVRCRDCRTDCRAAIPIPVKWLQTGFSDDYVSAFLNRVRWFGSAHGTASTGSCRTLTVIFSVVKSKDVG